MRKEVIEWHPVAKQLPEDDKAVLTIDGDGRIEYAYVNHYTSGEIWWWCYDSDHRIDTPKFWAEVRGFK